MHVKWSMNLFWIWWALTSALNCLLIVALLWSHMVVPDQYVSSVPVSVLLQSCSRRLHRASCIFHRRHIHMSCTGHDTHGSHGALFSSLGLSWLLCCHADVVWCEWQSILTFVIWWLLHDDVFSFQMLKMLVLMFSPGRSCHHSFLLQRPVCLMMKMLCEYFLIYVDDCMFYSLRCSRCMMTTTIISISLCQSLDLY